MPFNQIIPKPITEPHYDYKEMITILLNDIVTEEQQIEFIVLNIHFIKFIKNPSEAVLNAYTIAHKL